MAFGRFRQLSEEAASKARLQKPRVLVVDDDPRIRQGLEANLKTRYQVHLCSNGDEGIRALNEQTHAVILDIKMPGKDGLQIYQEMKASFPNVPIIFYSAYQNVLEGARLSQQYQPFNYIDKGSDIQELINTVDRAVEYYTGMLRILTTEQRLQGMKRV